MSCLASPSLFFYRMLDFTLAPFFQLVSCQGIFILMPLSPDFWLVRVGFLVVQLIHIHQFDGGFDLIVCLKSQMVRYVS